MAFEKDLFEELVKALERAEKNQTADMSGSIKDERKHRLVRFLEEVPAFLGFLLLYPELHRVRPHIQSFLLHNAHPRKQQIYYTQKE